MIDRTVIRADAPLDLSLMGDDELAALQADPSASRALLVAVVAEMVRRRRARTPSTAPRAIATPPEPSREAGSAPASCASAERLEELRAATLGLGERVARLERRVAMLAWWAVALPGAWALLRRGRPGG